MVCKFIITLQTTTEMPDVLILIMKLVHLASCLLDVLFIKEFSRQWYDCIASNMITCSAVILQ